MKKREGTEFSQANEKYKNIKRTFSLLPLLYLRKVKVHVI